jgi:hypothetical protein
MLKRLLPIVISYGLEQKDSVIKELLVKNTSIYTKKHESYESFQKKKILLHL